MEYDRLSDTLAQAASLAATVREEWPEEVDGVLDLERAVSDLSRLSDDLEAEGLK